MIKIFFDSSVVISALISKTGGSRELIEHSRHGRIFAVISQGVLEEFLSKANKIGRDEKTILNFMKYGHLVVRAKLKANEIKPYLGTISDLKDSHVIAGAKLTKCDFLVSLDKKHILTVKHKFQPMQIVRPEEMLEIIVDELEKK